MDSNARHIVITNDFFGGTEGLRSILNDYYEQAISRLEEKEQALARIFVEEGLIVDGKRVLVSEGVEKAKYHIDADLLAKLLSSRLIRTETTHLGRSFEISHDALIEPIQTSFKKRKEEEERLEALRQLEAERERLRRERRRRQLISAVALAIFSLFLIALYQSVRNNRLKNENATKAQTIEEQLVEIQASQQIQDSLMFNNLINQGLQFRDQGQYDNALAVLELAGRYNVNYELIDSLVRATRRVAGAQQTVQQLIEEARKAYQRRDYQRALQKLNEAATRNEDGPAGDQIRKLMTEYDSQAHIYFVDQVNRARNIMEKGRNCPIARDMVLAVEGLIPYLQRFDLREAMISFQEIKNCQ